MARRPTTLLTPQNLTVQGSFSAGTGGGAITTSGGVLGFGTFTTSAGMVGAAADGIGGYIEIIDKDGVARKIAIVT